MNPFLDRRVVFVATAALAACSGTGTAMPPAPTALTAPAAHTVAVTDEDRAAARKVSHLAYRAFPVSSLRSPQLHDATTHIYPADVHYYRGPLMRTAAEHNIYVNCKSHDERCWGDPEGFLRNLAGSTLIKLLTQYTNAGAGAYTFADGTPVAYTAYSNYYYFTDLLSILHAVAKLHGTGYANEYHIFLPKGTDTCFDGTIDCYSPDVPSTFYFCAYHGLAIFPDIGDTVFSVEPYQDVPGSCTYASLPNGAPGSLLTDSTDSALAHEMFESITDPRPQLGFLGWYNFAYNDEIADLCAPWDSAQTIGRAKYFIQTMYSDKYHACTDGP